MSQFPIYHPLQKGDGRLIAICAFKEDQKNEFQSYIMKQRSSSAVLNLWQGSDMKNGGLKLLFADLTLNTKVSRLPGTSFT
jgi:hypothetical protein